MGFEFYRGDCAEVLKEIDGGSIDLTVTSPPYDNLRTYNGFTFNFETIAKELYRVTKQGGVVVWVVGDATIKGSETGTSFRQALFFMECGFNLHDTMIYQKAGTGACGSNLAYWQSFEYMFVLAKGRPKAVNRIADHINTRAGTVCTKGRVGVDGRVKDTKRRIVPGVSVRSNIWRYSVGNAAGGNAAGGKVDHPAVFPEALARDHIMSWSNEGALVLDPFMGSGTTGVACADMGRNFVGIELDRGYYRIARKRIAEAYKTKAP